MRTLIILSVLTIFFAYNNFDNNSIAQEIVLCVSNSDQYVVGVDQKGDCVDGEVQQVIKGDTVKDLKEYLPVANFSKDEDCKGEGMIIDIGFDKNDNGQLDQDEFIGRSGYCNP